MGATTPQDFIEGMPSREGGGFRAGAGYAVPGAREVIDNSADAGSVASAGQGLAAMDLGISIPELAPEGQESSNPGPMNDLETSMSKSGGLYGSQLEFPSDIQDVGQRHFVRFTLLDAKGAKFTPSVINLNNRKPDTSTIGMGGVVSGASGMIGNQPVTSAVKSGAIAQEEKESFLTGLLEQRMTEALGPAIKISLQQAVGGFLPPAIGGMAGGLLSTLGGALGGFGGALGDVVGDISGELGDMAGSLVGDTVASFASEAVVKTVSQAVNQTVSAYVTQGIGQVQNLAMDALSEAVGDIPLGDALGAIGVNAAGVAVSAAMGIMNEGSSKPSSDPASIAKAAAEDSPITADSLKMTTGGQSWKQGDVKNPLTKILGDILLYVPVGISESYNTRWSGVDKKFAGTISENMKDGNWMKQAEGLFGAISGNPNSSPALRLAAKEMLGKVVAGTFNNEQLKNAFMQSDWIDETKLLVHPHFTTVFEGVQPRTFTFNFKFAPKNPLEAQTVQQIIKKFKAGAAPSNLGALGAQRYWSRPYTFGIEYWNAQRLHKLKPCALSTISVNYGASGTNHTFYDGFPLQTDMSLTFVETSLLTREDIEQGY